MSEFWNYNDLQLPDHEPHALFSNLLLADTILSEVELFCDAQACSLPRTYELTDIEDFKTTIVEYKPQIDIKLDEPPSVKPCCNCGTIQTPIWRRDDQGNVVCNACGI